MKEYRLRGWNREAGCFDDERSLRANSREARQSPYYRENQRTSTSRQFHSLDAGRRRGSMERYQESKNERSRSRSHKTSSGKEVKREVLLAQEKKAVDPRIDMSNSGKYHKVNRCLARYSPRATTTNRSTNRALNKPAWPSPYQPKMPILGQTWTFLGKKS